MAEIKRNFGQAKMNKDMDERVLEPGQYRDANNIQIASSDGSDVGSVQTILGNTEVTADVVLDDFSTCVGVYPVPEDDMIYYFVYGGGHPNLAGHQPDIYKDYIIQYNTNTQNVKYVFVDIYKVKDQTNETINNTAKLRVAPGTSPGDVYNYTGIRKGMLVTGTFTNSSGGNITAPNGTTVANSATYYVSENDNVEVTDVIRDGSNGFDIILSKNLTTTSSDTAVFTIPRVLEFSPFRKITAIDHVDDILFFSDGDNEPKKINIKRSIQGTGGNFRVQGWTNTVAFDAQNNSAANNTQRKNIFFGNNANFHTRVSLENELAMNRLDNEPVFTRLRDITVIKPSPKFPLKLTMSSQVIDRIPVNSDGSLGDANSTASILSAATKFRDSSGDVFESGHTMNVSTTAPVDFRVGDIVVLTDDMGVDIQDLDPAEALVRATITDAPGGMPNNGGSTGPYELTINSVSDRVQAINTDFQIALEQEISLFKFKFPRFSYRYKYVDGEYSAFAPFTEVAFLPGNFDYVAKKGFNLGMVNQVKTIKLENYFHEFNLVPSEVVGIDLLYKEETSPVVYTVKSLTSDNKNPEWPDRTNIRNKGSYTITSEMIHAVVPSNQILRPYDNVPKSAKALAITGNRLVFGNYKQNYDLEGDINLRTQWRHEFGSNYKQPSADGLKSVKTLRTYQVGVVFSDDFGRETPVLVPKNTSGIFLDKKYSCHTNKLNVRLDYTGTKVSSWAKYLKYYIKETSNEYYNLAMDRWYDAEDGNVYLSFPSSERNKVDIDTYLILKKQHDSDTAVLESARYKILDISDDAPDYIKTKKITHGSVAFDNSTSVATGNAFHTTLTTQVNFIVANADWQSTFGEDFLADTWSRVGSGRGYVRLIGTSGSNIVTTDWVQVANIKRLGASGSNSNFAIRINNKFGDDANMDLFGAAVSYTLELREDSVTQRPEFDGRFFVKVFKDLLLEKAVMVDLDPTASLSLIKSFDIRLVVGVQNKNGSNFNGHPTSTSTSSAGHTHTYHNGNFTDFNQSFHNSFNAQNEGFGFCASRSRTEDWWVNFGNDKMYIAGFNFARAVYTSPGVPHHGDVNGVDTSHLGGFGLGKGCISHASSYSRLFFGMSARFSGLTSTQKDFYETMKKPGTIFKFRDDPTDTYYRVIKRGGYSNLAHYHDSAGCSICDEGEQNGACDGSLFNIMFERLDGNGPMDPSEFDILSLMKSNGTTSTPIDIFQQDYVSESGGSELSTDNPAIFETEPKEDVGLDLYYEATGYLPLDVNADTNELLIPIGSTLTNVRNASSVLHKAADGVTDVIYEVTAVNQDDNKDITNITVRNTIDGTMGLTAALNHNQVIGIQRFDGSTISLYVVKESGNYAASDTAIGVLTGNSPTDPQGSAVPWRAPHFNPMTLGWSNVFAFGNGIESDRIRDGFNLSQLSNGVKASTTPAVQYAEEHRSSGFIFSGIFNSTSGVNDLNQFIQAEPITKDLNPSYGSIQAMYARNTNTLAFCEDKVLSILTNKDALFNADGNANVTSSSNVLGAATPLQGDYGISTNPESLAITPDSVFFCDQMRSQVLKLQGNSISVISSVGMKDYFNDNLKNIDYAVGSYDSKKSEYNLTLVNNNGPFQLRPTTTTISWSDTVNGWTSFKDFAGLELGVSLNNEYYTFKEGSMWKHHTNSTVNNFYGTQNYSDITMIFNDMPSSVKSFNLVNYEGTQARISQFTTVTQDGVDYTDGEYYNLTAKTGWYLENLTTDLQDAENIEFKEKEGKWFANLKGVTSTEDNLDQKEFSVQGLGTASVSSSGSTGKLYEIRVRVSSTASDGTNWDSSGADTTDFRILDGPTILQTEGASTGTGSVYATITNQIINSSGATVYSGLNLDAADFSTPGGTYSTSGTGNATAYTYTNDGSWNADPEVSKVVFTNNGIAGDPGNTVNVQIHYSSFTMPSAHKNIFADVDYGGTTIITSGSRNRDVVFRVSYDDQPVSGESNPDNITITNTTITNITKTSDDGYAPLNKTDKHTGIVPEGQTTLVAKYNITADNDYYLEPISGSNDGINVRWNVLPSNAAYEPFYTFNVVNDFHTATGQTTRIKSCALEISYTPPVGIPGLDPDPSDMNAVLNDIRLTHNVKALPTVGNQVIQATRLNQVFPGGQQVVQVTSNSVGNFKLKLLKLNAGLTAATGSYDFANTAWNFSDATKELADAFVAADEVPGLPGLFTRTYSLQMSTTSDANAPGTYSVVLAAGSTGSNDLTIASTAPDAINEMNFTCLDFTGNTTFTPGTKTNLTASGSVTFNSERAMTAVGAGVGTKNFSFTYTKSSGTMTLDRQPNVRDVVGAETVVNLTSDQLGNVTTLPISDTEGIKVGMTVEGEGIAEGTTVTTVNENTSVVISTGTTAAIGVEINLTFKSDYIYQMTDAIATINGGATAVTVAGNIKINQYGKKGDSTTPDGNIILKPHFITIS